MTLVAIQKALLQVNAAHPEVTQVFFSENGSWRYCGPDWESPKLSSGIDHKLLEGAMRAAEQDKGFPCAYRLIFLDELYFYWDRLRDIPVTDETCVLGPDRLDADFLHFLRGTHREDVWHWFEAMHPDFVAGEVLQGIRKRT